MTYRSKNSYCMVVIDPKMNTLRKQFAHLLQANRLTTGFHIVHIFHHFLHVVELSQQLI